MGGCAGRSTVWAASSSAEHAGHRHELDKCGSGSTQITSFDRICYILTDQSFSEQGTQTTGWWFYILFFFLNKHKVVLLSTITVSAGIQTSKNNHRNIRAGIGHLSGFGFGTLKLWVFFFNYYYFILFFCV